MLVNSLIQSYIFFANPIEKFGANIYEEWAKKKFSGQTRKHFYNPILN